MSKIQIIEKQIKNITNGHKSSWETGAVRQQTTFATLKKYIKHLASIILEEEEIKGAMTGYFENYVYTIFITNRRVILLNKTLLNIKQIDIPIEKITSIAQKQGVFYGEIAIWNGNTQMILKQIPKNQMPIFINLLNEQIDNYKTFSIQIKQTTERDLADKIEKLSELYKDGVLTEYEFATKKMELLEKYK